MRKLLSQKREGGIEVGRRPACGGELDPSPRGDVVFKRQFVGRSTGHVVPDGTNEFLAGQWLQLGEMNNLIGNGISPDDILLAHASKTWSGLIPNGDPRWALEGGWSAFVE